VPAGTHNVAVVAIRLGLAGNEVAFDHMGITSLGCAKRIQNISLVGIGPSPILPAIKNTPHPCASSSARKALS
jgi:hypothetical protein